jgi:hypothetical protein
MSGCGRTSAWELGVQDRCWRGRQDKSREVRRGVGGKEFNKIIALGRCVNPTRSLPPPSNLGVIRRWRTSRGLHGR